MSYFENWFATILGSTASVPVPSRGKCQKYTYQLVGQGVVYGTNFACDNSTYNLAPGNCIVSLPFAAKVCDRLSQCGGFEVTTNTAWHDLFDVNGLPSAELFSVTDTATPNAEWTPYLKVVVQWTLMNRKYAMLIGTFNFLRINKRRWWINY